MKPNYSQTYPHTLKQKEQEKEKAKLKARIKWLVILALIGFGFYLTVLYLTLDSLNKSV